MLDELSLRAAIESKEFEQAVIDDETEAAKIGVHAVPAFVANRQFALSGVQPVSALEELVKRSRQ